MLKQFCTVCLLSIFITSAYADNEQMKITLVDIVNQLQNVKTLIQKAKRQQEKNPSVSIHFESWMDANGKKHNGLKQDIEQIRLALIDFLNQASLTPRRFKPISNDFIGGSHV